MATRTLPLQAYLRQCFRYDETSGALHWLERPIAHFRRAKDHVVWNQRYAGKEIRSLDGKGYLRVSIDGVRYPAHRVIWKMIFGDEAEIIDHVNGCKTDNRLCNVRSVTPSDNLMNAKRYVSNTTGVVGVSWSKSVGKWQVQMGGTLRRQHLGYFELFDDAVRVRRQAEFDLGYHPNHGRT